MDRILGAGDRNQALALIGIGAFLMLLVAIDFARSRK